MKRTKLLFLVILGIGLMTPLVWGDWTVGTIGTQGFDDGFITETGVKWFNTYFVQLKAETVNTNGYFIFRTMSDLGPNMTINNAYLQLTAPPGLNSSGTVYNVTAYGLRVNDIPAWSAYEDTPDLNSYPQTTAFTNFDVDPIVNGTSYNVTVTEIVREIYSLYNWTNYKDFGFRISSVQDPIIRYAQSREYSSSNMAKLYIEYTNETATGGETYRGYVITPAPSTEYIYGSIVINSTQIGEYIRPVSGQGENGLGYSANIEGTTLGNNDYFGFPVADHDVGFIRNSRLYYVSQRGGLNTTLTLMSVPLSDLTSETYHGVILDVSSGNPDQWDLAIDTTDPTEDFLHIASIKDNRLYYANMSLTYFNASTTETLHIGGASTEAGGVDIEISTGGHVYISAGIAKTGGSALAIENLMMPDNRTAWYQQEIALSNTVQYPSLEEMGGYMHLQISRLGGTDYRYYYNAPDGTPSFTFKQLLVTSTSNMGDYRRMYYHTNFFASNVTYRDVLVDFVRFHKENPKQIGYNYIYQTAPGAFTATTFSDTGNANQTVDLYNMNVWEVAEGKYAYMATVTGQDSIYRHAQTVNSVYNLNHWNTPTYVGQWADYDWDMQTASTLLVANLIPSTQSGSGGFDVTDSEGNTVNNTCLDNAVTIEEVKACLDILLGGSDPQDPDPPGSTYPPDGPGALTRFNMRFWIWVIGWICVIAPSIRIASGGLPIQYYYGFFLMILTGIALIWSSMGI
jgi:hypothetical protein